MKVIKLVTRRPFRVMDYDAGRISGPRQPGLRAAPCRRNHNYGRTRNLCRMVDPIALAVDQNPGRTKSQLKDSCDALNMRKLRIQKKMRNLARDMRLDEDIKKEKLEEYQKLNAQLRETKIIEAEFNYTMHML